MPSLLRIILIGLLGVSACAGELRVASWNVRNYLVCDRMVDGIYRTDYPKPEAEKTALRAVIGEIDAEVLAVQEIGGHDFLRELRLDLQAAGIEYPYLVCLEGPDRERKVAFLSRLPFVEVREHDKLEFAYRGERTEVKRGVLEVVLETAGGRLHIFNLHLKSRYTDRSDDPQSLERRNGEATVIRDLLAHRLATDPDALFLVLGDFNDSPGSRPLRRFTQIGQRPLLFPIELADDRGDRWTHHYAREDAYDRVDFALVSDALRAHLSDHAGEIFDNPAVRMASDHRPVLVNFELSGIE